MALSVTGEDAIVEAIKTLLQAQLQDELTAQTTAAGLAWTITAPDNSEQGYSTDETWTPKNRQNSIKIYCDRVEDIEQFVNVGGPIRQSVEIGIRWSFFSKKGAQFGTRRRLQARAVKKLLREYWYNTYGPATASWLNTDNLRIEYSNENFRAQDDEPGQQASTGDNIDYVIVRPTFTQRVTAPQT